MCQVQISPFNMNSLSAEETTALQEGTRTQFLATLDLLVQKIIFLFIFIGQNLFFHPNAHVIFGGKLRNHCRHHKLHSESYNV